MLSNIIWKRNDTEDGRLLKGNLGERFDENSDFVKRIGIKLRAEKIVSRKEETTSMRGFMHYWRQMEKEECFQKMRRLYLLLLFEYDNYLLAGFS